MLNRITAFFESTMSFTTIVDDCDNDHKRQMAAAALFIEVLKADFDHNDDEWLVVESSLKELFGLSPDEITQITKLAEEDVENAISLQSFTRCINDSYTNEEKLTIVEMLWRVALADGVIDKHENHIMRKIGSLLYIPHKDYVRAKQRARD